MTRTAGAKQSWNRRGIEFPQANPLQSLSHTTHPTATLTLAGVKSSRGSSPSPW